MLYRQKENVNGMPTLCALTCIQLKSFYVLRVIYMYMCTCLAKELCTQARVIYVYMYLF